MSSILFFSKCFQQSSDAEAFYYHSKVTIWQIEFESKLVYDILFSIIKTR